jgi:phage protein D
MVDKFTPTARIEIDGEDKTRQIWEYLESLSYEDAEGDESDSLEICVANEPAFTIPEHGAEVRLWIGYKEEEQRLMGTFEVDEASIELNPAVMRILARSASFTKGTDKQKEDKTWENLTLAELAGKIAEKHGYKNNVTLDIYYESVSQTQESDLNFLKRLAEEANGSFAIRDKTILICPPDSASRPKAEIAYTETCRGSFTWASREKYGKVQAKWWDVLRAEEQKVEVGGGEGDAVYKIKKSFKSASEAQTAAKNKMAKLKRGTFRGNLTIPGDAALVAGAEITLSGFKPDAVNISYLGTKVRHSMSKSNWTTQVCMERLP